MIQFNDTSSILFHFDHSQQICTYNQIHNEMGIGHLFLCYVSGIILAF